MADRSTFLVTIRQPLRDDAGGLGAEQLLVVLAGGKEGLEIGSSIGLRPGGATDSIAEGGELAVSQEVGDIEVDLPQDAVELGRGELDTGERGEVGQVHGGGGLGVRA